MSSLRCLAIVATFCASGCPSKTPETPKQPDDTVLRIRIARAEARRAVGVPELVDIATTGDTHAKELAVRGLGRIGGKAAIDALERATRDRDPEVIAAALEAIGVLGSLDDLDAETARRVQDIVWSGMWPEHS